MSVEKSKRQKPFKWLPEETWHDLVRLAELLAPTFGSVLEDISQSESAWRNVCPLSLLCREQSS